MGDGLHGGAFIYTNRDSLSLGVVAQAHSLKARNATIYDALEKFKRHPAIVPLLEGGRFLEYSAHLIPEAGINMVPKLYTGGMLLAGDAAGLVLAGGVFLEGVNFAIAAGQKAAETTFRAFEKGMFDAAAMSDYEARLKSSFVLQDINRFKTAIPMLLNERLYEVYPSFICRTLENWFMVDGTGHPKLAGMAKRLLGEDLGLWQMAKDGYQFGRAMLW
jgi:electron transfer flavoprotein-quinone oxidoreductase